MKYQNRSNLTTECSFSGNSAGLAHRSAVSGENSARFANRSAPSPETVLGSPTAVLLPPKQCSVRQPQCSFPRNSARFANRSAASPETVLGPTHYRFNCYNPTVWKNLYND